MNHDAPRTRGLQAIEQARELRGKVQWPSARFWGWVGLVLAVTAILHWKWSQGQVESARQALLARQRGVAVELGPRWTPLRDSIERWTVELARDPGGEVVDRDALAGWDFRSKPGVYLRLRAADATSAESIEKRSKDSLRDAFTACLMRVPNPNPLAGAECKKTRDCPTGEVCNELDRCSQPAQPYNLRVAYRTLRVLSPQWVREVEDAGGELRVRLLAASFDDAIRDDVPVAIDLLTRAQYYLVVLDEAADGEGADASAPSSAPHPARVGLWRLSDGKLVLRIRREAAGQLVGGIPTDDADAVEARARQANSCALALAVREAMGDTSGAAPAE